MDNSEGYYAEYDIHSYLGETLAEAKATKKEMQKECLINLMTQKIWTI